MANRGRRVAQVLQHVPNDDGVLVVCGVLEDAGLPHFRPARHAVDSLRVVAALRERGHQPAAPRARIEHARRRVHTAAAECAERQPQE